MRRFRYWSSSASSSCGNSNNNNKCLRLRLRLRELRCWAFWQALIVWALLAVWATTPELGGSRDFKFLTASQKNARVEAFLEKQRRHGAAADAWLLSRMRPPAANTSDEAASLQREKRDPFSSNPLYSGLDGGLPAICVGFLAVANRPGGLVADAVYSVFRDVDLDDQMGNLHHGPITAIVQLVVTDNLEPRVRDSSMFKQGVDSAKARWKKLGGVTSLQRAIPRLQVVNVSACPAGLSHCTSNLMYGYHYSAMLDRCIATQADLVVLIEEDVWATRHFFPKLLSLVAQARDQANGKVPYSKHPREDLGLQMPSEYLRRSSLIRADQQVLKDEPWMMKLFVTTWWSGWGREVQHYFELGGVFVIGAAAGFFVSPLFSPSLRTLRTGRTRQGWHRPLLGVAVGGLFIGIAVVIGRQNIPFIEFLTRWGVHENNHGANSLANVFPRQTALQLADHLRQKVQRAELNPHNSNALGPLDVTVMEWQLSSSVKQYLEIPCLVEHVGLYTSIDSKVRNQRTQEPVKRFAGLKQASVFIDDE